MMTKKILAVSAIAGLMMATPAMAQVERHQNQSLNGFSGVAQPGQPAAFRTVPHGKAANRVEAVGSGNPGLESFNPNAANFQPSRFGTAPNVAENPDFDWIDQADVGA